MARHDSGTELDWIIFHLYMYSQVGAYLKASQQLSIQQPFTFNCENWYYLRSMTMQYVFSDTCGMKAGDMELVGFCWIHSGGQQDYLSTWGAMQATDPDPPLPDPGFQLYRKVCAGRKANLLGILGNLSCNVRVLSRGLLFCYTLLFKLINCFVHMPFVSLYMLALIDLTIQKNILWSIYFLNLNSLTHYIVSIYFRSCFFAIGVNIVICDFILSYILLLEGLYPPFISL